MHIKKLILPFLLLVFSASGIVRPEIDRLLSTPAFYYGLEYDPQTANVTDRLCRFSISNPNRLIDNIAVVTNNINSDEFTISIYESTNMSSSLRYGHFRDLENKDYYERTYNELLAGIENDINIGLYNEDPQLINSIHSEYVENIHRGTLNTPEYNIELLVKTESNGIGRDRVSTIEIRVYSNDYQTMHKACKAAF